MKAANAIVQQTAQKRMTFSSAINTPGCQALLMSAITDPKRRARFATAIVAVVSANPDLQKCDPNTILSSALQGEALELSPSPSLGHYYVIPYGEKATFQIGVNGLKQLAMRSGQYKDIDTTEVREGEYKGRDPFTGKPLFEFISDDEIREESPIVGYLAYFELMNGFRKAVYFSKEKTLNWADRYSQAFDKELFMKYEIYRQTGEGLTERELRSCSSPWYETFDLMGQKTVLRQLLGKWGILSIEMQTVLEQEERAEAGADGFEIDADMTANASEDSETPAVDAEIIETKKKPKAKDADVEADMRAEEEAYNSFFGE